MTAVAESRPVPIAPVERLGSRCVTLMLKVAWLGPLLLASTMLWIVLLGVVPAVLAWVQESPGEWWGLRSSGGAA